MNKHFEDAKYYLQRAGEHAKRGISEELEPIQERVRELAGEDEEVIEEDVPEGRLDKLRAELDDLETRAEGETKEAIQTARAKLNNIRGEPADK